MFVTPRSFRHPWEHPLSYRGDKPLSHHGYMLDGLGVWYNPFSWFSSPQPALTQSVTVTPKRQPLQPVQMVTVTPKRTPTQYQSVLPTITVTPARPNPALTPLPKVQTITVTPARPNPTLTPVQTVSVTPARPNPTLTPLSYPTVAPSAQVEPNAPVATQAPSPETPWWLQAITATAGAAAQIKQAETQAKMAQYQAQAQAYAQPGITYGGVPQQYYGWTPAQQAVYAGLPAGSAAQYAQLSDAQKAQFASLPADQQQAYLDANAPAATGGAVTDFLQQPIAGMSAQTWLLLGGGTLLLFLLMRQPKTETVIERGKR